jgi:hypothetical protein
MPEQKSECPFRSFCESSNLRSQSPGNHLLQKIYCIGIPQYCAIYQAKVTGNYYDYSSAHVEAAGVIDL